jgi:hypothetical protein
MSLYSDLIKKPYLGLAKPSTNVLAFTAANAELQALATDDTITGVNSGSLRLRNVYAAAGAGPAIFLEGTNSSTSVKTLGKIEARFDSAVDTAEDSYLGFSVLDAGAVLTLKYSGQYASFHPSAIGATALGTSTLPFSELYLGNAAGTRSIKATHTGPGGTSAIVADAGGLGIYAGATQVAFAFPTTLQVGPSNGYGSLAALTVGGLAAGADVYGVASGPSGETKTSVYGFAAVSAIGAAGNRTTVIDYVGATSSTGATATTHAVFATGSGLAWTATNRYGFYGTFTAAANRYNLAMTGDAQNFILGLTGFGAGATAPGYQIDVNHSTAALGSVRVRNTNATPTADLLVMYGGGDTTGYYNLRVLDSTAAINRFSVRGDGTIFFGATTTVTEVSQFNYVGRSFYTVNTTHDVSAGIVIAATIISTTAYTVADAKQNDFFRFTPTDIQVSGTGVANGITYNMITSVSGASSIIRGINGVTTISGAGTSYVGLFRAFASVGHTGNQYGVTASMTSQATTNQSIAFQALHAGRLHYGMIMQGLSPGDQLDYGLYIDASNSVLNCAFTYIQRAGSVADYLSYIDSGATQRFKVDYLGNIVFAGSSRRIQAPMSSGTFANNFAFQSTSVNNPTLLQVIANGTGTYAQVIAFGGSDPDNASYLAYSCASSGGNSISSSRTGAGTTQTFDLSIDSVYAMRIQTNRDVLLGPSGAVTAMTAGFPYMPAVAGVPSGVPTARAGYVPFMFDTTNNRLYIYDGAWLTTTVFA